MMAWIDPLSRALHRNAPRHGPVMLMYHAITPGKRPPGWPWGVSLRQFCDQLDFLVAEGYTTPTMAELVAAPAKAWPERTAVITFDDGYADNLAAWEAMQRRGVRGTWFVVTGSIGALPQWESDGRPDGRLLHAAELREMQASGMEIASHSVNHRRLPELGDDTLRHEIVDSKATLEDILGNAICSFAFPYGAWDARSADAVRAAGYAGACTTRTGWALRDHDPFRLRRLTVVNGDTPARLARKLSLADNAVGWNDLAANALDRLRPGGLR